MKLKRMMTGELSVKENKMKLKLSEFTFFVITVLFLMTNSSFAAEAEKISSEKISDIVSQAYKQNPVKAVIYGIWQDGKPVMVDALGYSMTGVKASTDMHFRIGGVTETFLTTLLMKLVDEGKLNLDDKVSKWFPEYPKADQVTIKMLANSTSGYPDYVYAKNFAETFYKDVFKHWTSDALLKYAFVSPMLFKPGKSQQYSHTNYIILGNILEKITGEKLSILFNKYMYQPLKLNNTQFIETAEMPSPALHAFSSDRKIYEDSTFWNPSWTSATGLMISTINDLGVWANAFGTGKLLSKKTYDTLTASDTVGLGRNKADLYFAMGFGVMNHWLIQNPSFNGYSGVFAYLPEKKMTIVVFNTVKESSKENVNYSMGIFRALVNHLTPDYQLAIPS